MLKITAFNGSPKGKKSATHIMVEEFLAGASQAGAEVENILLAKRKIKHCLGCFSCWTKHLGKCVIKDDMADLLVKLKNSDIVVFATPLYIDNVSGILKVFMDRSIPLGTPYFEKDEQGEYRHGDREGYSASFERVPKLVIISNAGFPEQSHFQVLSLLMKRVARNLHSEVIAEIYRGQGPFLLAPVKELLPVIEKYKTLLRQAGHELVTDLRLTGDTKKALNEPLVPHDMYIYHVTKYWDYAIKSNDR
jgi:putative NADPH-quinone reductase